MIWACNCSTEAEVVRLTDFGTTYSRYARRAFQNLETARRALQDVQDLSQGELRVAFTPTFTEYHVAPVIEHFHSMYPGTEDVHPPK
jgi:LysR family transcriptional regulator, cyn operon transcriptional activator